MTAALRRVVAAARAAAGPQPAEALAPAEDAEPPEALASTGPAAEVS
jgi:hypothetical protein